MIWATHPSQSVVFYLVCHPKKNYGKHTTRTHHRITSLPYAEFFIWDFIFAASMSARDIIILLFFFKKTQRTFALYLIEKTKSLLQAS
jgi:hypothetical protein